MNSKEIIGGYVGTDQVQALYLGSELIWPLGPAPEPNYLMMPLTFEIESGGTIYWTTYSMTEGMAQHKTIQYSKDGGNTWTSVTSSRNGTAISVSAGDIVMFKGTNTTYGSASTNFSNFSGRSFPGTASKTDAYFRVYGNISSLLTLDNGDTYEDWATNYNCNYEYGDYWHAAGEHLFRGMFGYLGDHLTDVSNLILPSWDLQPYAYMSMFKGCTAITDSPVLPDRPNSGYGSYDDMFSGCTSLTGVTCLGEDLSGELSALDWLAGVSPTGVFRSGFYTSWVSGPNGVPDGWEVIPECICDDKYRGKFFLYPCDSEEECRCKMCQGGYNEGYCAEDPCGLCSGLTGEDYDTCLCENYGINCEDPGYDCENCDGDPECECVCAGGEWDGENCNYPEGTDCSDWENMGYSSYEDCVCQESYGGDCPDCANNWEEMGYESYEDCMCQIYGEGCEDPCDGTDCSDWEDRGYESYEDCNCAENDNCGEEELTNCSEEWENLGYSSEEECDCAENNMGCPEEGGEEEPEE